VGGLIVEIHWGGGHVRRIFLGCLSLGLGWTAGVSWARRRRLAVRLVCIGLGLAGALAVRWFVPDGWVSRWEASRMAERIDALRADDAATFGSLVEVRCRRAAMHYFPEYSDEIVAAELAWLNRSVQAAAADAADWAPLDPERAAQRLRDCQRALDLVPQADWAAKQLRDSWRHVLQARCQRLEAVLKVLLTRGELGAATLEARRAAGELLADVKMAGLGKEGDRGTDK
jgi:hypothetical protein